VNECLCRTRGEFEVKGENIMDTNIETSSVPVYGRSGTGMRILVMAAVEAERDAVLRGLNGDTRFDVLLAGVGPAAAAASTARVLAAAQYGLVVSAGIGGGFTGRAEVGSLVVASEIIAADLGAETPEGFSSLDELGFGSARVQVDLTLVERVSRALAADGLPVNTGPVITVSTVTGTSASAAEMDARVPGVAAEAMEGYGVAIAARDCGIPILEIRAVSNLVGPRDRTAWRIKEALGVLERASSLLSEVLL
jgi:futalosine hydrolase